MEKIYISKGNFIKGVLVCLLILAGIIGWPDGSEPGGDEWKEESGAVSRMVCESAMHGEEKTEDESRSRMLGVHVTGAVVEPDQILYLSEGSRVGDAVKAAGGANENADLSQLNLAGYIEDGQRIYVPVLGEKIMNPKNTDGENQENLLTNINLATKIELLDLPGIGEAYAERIIQHREENGPFEKIEDIMEVKGIGESKFNDLKDKITVE